ncbi:hypothetical protein BM451_21000 [Dickeya dadantii]|nr:hypothetical protein BM451_21000 [Dickeya dadantii]
MAVIVGRLSSEAAKAALYNSLQKSKRSRGLFLLFCLFLCSGFKLLPTLDFILVTQPYIVLLYIVLLFGMNELTAI